jgi:hypothetical protein
MELQSPVTGAANGGSRSYKIFTAAAAKAHRRCFKGWQPELQTLATGAAKAVVRPAREALLP